MSFRFWLEEITRIRLEDAVREVGPGLLDREYLVPVRKESNVEAASQLGIHTIHFKNTAQAISEVQTFLRS